ncbi:TetR/AcrR family transcriptional regulator [Flavivirga amylovorans]|uniref:TetR/AcrR family transcriptional regulator n=1 Tax=Flavivirga amylovorans TaxID=870486 RepID=A0ABT8X3V1_9FLAO|nr:TetR/AcrR family transcriptional regulator [Flavivirga amylovorans]MDO5988651.1 TetR/AcrR family transcriptional regulator [Flavivirga amylovorans]
MKTKGKIKNKARELFNQKGFKNVTLREVAKSLEKSYGNITYHFKTKNTLVFELYEDMVAETNEIMLSFDFQNLFLGILIAPRKTFEISMKYVFFYVDYVEIRRSYKDIYLKAENDNAYRKEGYMKLLKLLQAQKILREELTQDDLNYLMDLSGAMRTFFFLNLHPENFDDKALKETYVKYINHLIFPYLTKKGIEEYKLHLE